MFRVHIPTAIQFSLPPPARGLFGIAGTPPPCQASEKPADMYTYHTCTRTRSARTRRIRRPVRRQIPVFVLVHSQMFGSRFELLKHLNSHFVSLLKPKKAHIFVGTLICNTSNCLVFGILISTPFQCLLTYISKHLSRSPPFPPRRGTHPAVAWCCSVDLK